MTANRTLNDGKANAPLLLVQIDSGSAQTCPSTFLGSQNYIAASSAGTCPPSRSCRTAYLLTC
eukprot:scaffold78499_cov54-Phaeocystis_antarctica.AAC.2